MTSLLFQYRFASFPLLRDGVPAGLVTLSRIREVPLQDQSTVRLRDITCSSPARCTDAPARAGTSDSCNNPGHDEEDLDMTARPEDDNDAALGATRAALDRLALDRLVLDIRAWWARNRQLRDRERAGRLDERGAGPARGARDAAIG